MKKEEVNILKQKIHEANEAYMKGNPIIDDPTYDSLVEQLVDIEGEEARPYSRTKQSDSINDIVGTISNKTWFKCYYDSGGYNGQMISSDFEFMSDENIIKPYVSTSGHEYCLFRKTESLSLLLPIEYIYERFVNNRDIDLLNMNIVYKDNEYEINYDEIWKPLEIDIVKSNRYEISNKGRIRKIDGVPISIYNLIHNKYKGVTLEIDMDVSDRKKKYGTFLVHRLVASVFIKNPYPYMYKNINHINNIGYINNVWNLEWCDQQMNSQHASQLGLFKTERNIIHNFDVGLVDYIRDLLLENGCSTLKVYEIIHDKYPTITRGQIHGIKMNNLYKYSAKYSQEDLDRIAKTKVVVNALPTEILDLIRDLLLREDLKASPSKVCAEINRIQDIEIGIGVVKGVKSSNKAYYRSDRYDLLEFKRKMDETLIDGEGSAKKMSAISTEKLDLIRLLLLLKPLKGSPRMVYDIIDHVTHPDITESIVKHCAYDSNSFGAYNRSNKFDLEKFDYELKHHIFQDVTKEILDMFTDSYSNGCSDITDPGFDILMESYVEANGEESRPFLRAKQSDSINYIMGTLEKKYGITTPMRKGQQIYSHHFVKKYSLDLKRIVAQYKFDGCSVGFDFETERFFTRGNFDDGESMDVTPLFESKLPQMYELNRRYYGELKSAKFEFIMPYDTYNELYRDTYKRPRDAAAAALHVVSDPERMEQNIETCRLCTLIPLRAYDNRNNIHICGECIAFAGKANDYTRLSNLVDGLGDKSFRTSLNRTFNYIDKSDMYECDGVVVSVVTDSSNNEFLYDFDECDDTDYIFDEYECAIKILNLVKPTKLLNIKFSYGKTGRITPVAILEPISFDGVTVDHVTLSNLSRIQEDQLKTNDTVEIMYNIVPYMVRSFHDGDEPIQIPTTCPLCGYPLDISEGYKTAFCINKNCVGRNLGTITRYIEAVGIFNFGEATVSRLMEEHLISNIPDIYRLKESDISPLDRFGDKSAENLIKNINASKQHLTFPRFLSGFQFRYVSQKTWMDVCTELNLTPSLLMDSSAIQLAELITKSNIRNVGAATKRFLIEGFTDNLDIIKETMQYIPSFEPFKTISDYKGIITMTGTHDKSFIKDVTDAGYIVRDWSNKTDILVIPDESYTSNKVTAALKRAIPIYTLPQARNKLL